jgi:hypothetical protein
MSRRAPTASSNEMIRVFLHLVLKVPARDCDLLLPKDLHVPLAAPRRCRRRLSRALPVAKGARRGRIIRPCQLHCALNCLHHSQVPNRQRVAGGGKMLLPLPRRRP